ncbi:hypothetical protein BGZ49_001856 [Haplosporangium sp. Z 27]|nr:hypothetical protein BGZ49_001856 [Haplosporangium sp. Z 27]
MFGFLFIILTGVVAVQTKPKQETFVPYFTTQRKSRLSGSPSSSPLTGSSAQPGRGVAGWFTRNIIEPLAGPRVPEHTITDYYFFHVATLNNGTGQYLGIFQQWWVISELQEVEATGSGSAGNRSGNTFETQAEGQKQQAVQAKIKKDYHGAARAYIEAAKLYEKSGSDFNLMEAASAYEDASKAFNMAKQSENAARLFKLNERGGSRAAKVYNQLGDLLKAEDAGKAAEMYKEAAELYRSDGDGRALHATIRQAELLCVQLKYAEAFTLYNDTIIPETMSQEILQYTTRDYILKAIIAHLGATQGDWIVFEKDLEHYEDICADFQSYRGLEVLKKLAKAEREHDSGAFQEACQEFDRLHSTGMANWQVGLLLQEKKKLEEGSLL